MSSPAPKQAESEFDDLLGQLVDELAMTPASESAVQLVPDPPAAEAHVDSTHHMAAEAAAAAAEAASAAAAAKPQHSQSNTNLVKIVGIIAGSLTIVAIAALALFANSEPSAVDDGEAVASDVDGDRLAEVAATEQAAVERAEADRVAAERAELTARVVRIEAGLLADEAKAKAEASKSKPRVRRRRPKKPKKPTTKKPGDSFEDL